MASRCTICGYAKTDCNDLICPRCNSLMVFDGCGSCNKCSWKVFAKKKKSEKLIQIN